MEKFNFEEDEIIGIENNAYLNGLKDIEIFIKKIQIIEDVYFVRNIKKLEG